jgi:hypothetical protein
MLQPITEYHDLDAQGNPAGGTTSGIGLSITWQKGPLGRHTPDCNAGNSGVCEASCDRKAPNGAFVEGVIAAALGRLQHYQAGKFKCRENALAITKVEEALHWLQSRTTSRELRRVEGTHEV